MATKTKTPATNNAQGAIAETVKQPKDAIMANIAVASVTVENQVRTSFDETSIYELAADMDKNGLLQPILVRLDPKNANGHILVAGERRLRAAKTLKWEYIPATILNHMTDQEHLMAQLAENIQRENLTKIEEAKQIRMIFEVTGTVQATAEVVHKSKGWVSKRLSASEPDLWKGARALLENGQCEDLEIILTLSRIAAYDQAIAEEIAERIKEGKAGRKTVRDELTKLQKKAKGESEETEEEGKGSESTSETGLVINKRLVKELAISLADEMVTYMARLSAVEYNLADPEREAQWKIIDNLVKQYAIAKRGIPVEETK